eukprot:TRINITY_DN5715_c0_g3_i2.p1 TRINITY_DN5715_c0_g3~~TRINITY_DN5715_c0_g3_i2.p1  ORF type:complete len:141 (+),score=24.32 TRINITY_DN5715_c0_g3_i2:59-481(+)
MGCGATRPARFAQVVPNSDEIEHEQEGAARRRGPPPLPKKEGVTTKQQEPEGELGLLLFSAIVSEPKSLVTWNSYDFMPSAQEEASGHPIPPCAPTHKRYVRRICMELACITLLPQAFRDRVMRHRDHLELKALKCDEQS